MMRLYFLILIIMAGSINSLAHAGYTAACQVVNEPTISNLPDSLNIKSTDISISGTTLTTKIYLKQIPATLKLNYAPKGYMEYKWGVGIDIDNNKTTGDYQGFDYLMSTYHYNATDSSTNPITVAFGEQFQTKVWFNDQNGTKSIDTATLAISLPDNSITLSGNVPGLTGNSRLGLFAYDKAANLNNANYTAYYNLSSCQAQSFATNANCTTVDKNTNINVACALYNNKNYQATLPFDLGRYQRNNELTWGVTATEQAVSNDPNKECVKVDSAVNLYMPCLIYQDQKYFAHFKWNNSYFSLDLSDFHSANSASLFITDPNSQVKAAIVSNNTGAVFLQHRPAANLPAELDKVVLYHADGTTSELELTPTSKKLQPKASLPLSKYASCVKQSASNLYDTISNIFTFNNNDNDVRNIDNTSDSLLTCIQGGIDEAQSYDEKKIGNTLKGAQEQIKWQLEDAKFNSRGVVAYSLDKIESTLSDNALANLVIQRVRKLLPDKINLPSKPDPVEEALIPSDKLLVLDNNNTPTKLSTLVTTTPVTPNPTPEPVATPTVSAVSPDTATVGEKLILSVRGKNMYPLNTVSVTLDDCPNVINDGGTEDLMSFTCTPTSVGTKAGTAKETKTGKVLFTFQEVVSATSSKPVISAFTYTPDPAIQNQLTTFSITGSNLTDSISYELNGCAVVNKVSGGTSSKREFTCTPTELGAWQSTVRDTPIVQNFTVTVVKASVKTPAITNLSPKTVTKNTLTDFAVEGTDLTSAMTFTMDGCSDVKVLGNSSASVRRFSCTPTKVGIVKVIAKDRPTQKIFDVTVSEPAAAQSTVTWNITDNCDDGSRVDYRFWNAKGDRYPEAFTPGYGKTQTHVLECDVGEQVCFGGETNNKPFGLGNNFNNRCTDCCATCGGGTYKYEATCSGTTLNTGSYSIGSTGPAGGIVFYVDSSGQHGLEAQRADYRDAVTWTEALSAASSYGAGWHLPTKDELNKLYLQKNVVSGFSNVIYYYWSSTENEVTYPSYPGVFVWVQDFFRGGSQSASSKDNKFPVRAVRAF